MKTPTFVHFVNGAQTPSRRLTYLVARRSACLTAFAALRLLVPDPLQGAVKESWVHRYSNVVSNSVDQAFKVVSDAAGDIIVAGTSDDGITGKNMLTIKYSGTNGSVLWQKRYHGPDKLEDRISGLAVDGIGNVVVLATSAMFGEWGPGNGEYYTAKYAAVDGVILWEKRRPKGTASFSSNLPALLAVDRRGDVVVSMPGLTNPDGSSHAYITKYAGGSGTLLWEKRYESPFQGYDWLNSLAVDANGNVFAAGRSDVADSASEDYVAKYSADGDIVWEKHSISADESDPYNPRPVAVDSSGNLVVISRLQNEAKYSIQTRKYSGTDGGVLWTQRYEGPPAGYYSPEAVELDSNGNVMVTARGYLVKYAAANGALLWEKWEEKTISTGLAVDVEGNVIVTGVLTDLNYTAKYAGSDGGLIWRKRFDAPGISSPDEGPTSATTDRNGNIYVTGTSGQAYCTARYEPTDGTMVWKSRHKGPANRNDQATGVAVDASGNVVVTGTSQNDGAADFYTAKYAAADGTLIWEKRYHGPFAYGYDFSQAVALDGSGNVVVTGSSYDNGMSAGNLYTAKHAAPDGALLWEQRYNGPVNGSSAMAVTIDGSGNAVMTGYVRGSDFRADYYTAKYAAADGALLWEKHFNSTTNGDDTPSALAVDSKGNVVVTGGSGSSANFLAVYDSYTVKYAATDGALLWEQGYNEPANIDGQAYAAAVDGSGNVVVTGRSSTSVSAEDGFIYTAKYAAEDGVLLWEKSYKGPGKGYEKAFAIVVDSTGNAVVTGQSQGDFYTAKYAGADGALLWDKRGPVGDARAVRVTGSGDVVVTGNSYGDYYTAKYASADGALLWEKRYNGPANDYDFVAGLAIGPDGRVAVTGSSNGNFGSGEPLLDYATVVYREALSAVAIEHVSSGVRLGFTGSAAQSYSIQRAPAVTGPWNTINTQTAPASGILEYLDANSPADTAFYRMREP